jgi:alcohol dehydrogenase/propanol-preferring alcohol dehydrogenase
MALKDLTIQGSDLGSLAEMGELMELVRAGRIEPIPFETRSIECVNESLTDLEAGRVLGRVVLNP